jgi:hypothetical protein
MTPRHVIWTVAAVIAFVAALVLMMIATSGAMLPPTPP